MLGGAVSWAGDELAELLKFKQWWGCRVRRPEGWRFPGGDLHQPCLFWPPARQLDGHGYWRNWAELCSDMNLPWTRRPDPTITFTASWGHRFLSKSRVYLSGGSVPYKWSESGNNIVSGYRKFFSPLPSFPTVFFKVHFLIFMNSLSLGRVRILPPQTTPYCVCSLEQCSPFTLLMWIVKMRECWW